MMAATSVEAEITASSRASSPEAMRESDFTFSPVALTYCPSRIFTTTATAMMTSAGTE